MYTILSFNYRNSDIALRSRLATLSLTDFRSFREFFLLTTCNRIEFIFSRPPNVEQLYQQILSKVINREELAKGEWFQNREAVEHIFKVASSLDSMVVGETQITGQLKDAFREAYEQGFIGKELTRLLHFSLRCAREIRNYTKISSEPISVAKIAVKKAEELLGELSGYSAIIVGAGDTARRIAKNLVKMGVNILLVNRSIENGVALKEELGDEVNIEVHPLEMLTKLINNYRLLFSATASPIPIIRREFIRETKFKRYWFDLAIPADIETPLPDSIHLVRVDDLEEISQKNRQKREQEIEKANLLIVNCVDRFYTYLKEVAVEPTIKLLQQKARKSAEKALTNALKKKYLPMEVAEEVERVLHNAFKRFLHHPSIRLRQLSNSPQGDLYIKAIKELFGEQGPEMDINKCEYHLEMGLIK